VQTDMVDKLHRPAKIFVAVLMVADQGQGRSGPKLNRAFTAGTAEDEFKTQRTGHTRIPSAVQDPHGSR